MAEAEKSLGSVRFGPFELLLETKELRKNGIPVKLSGQAIQVLAMLTANPGKLVTREELQKKLWPGDCSGDFEHGLNAAINKLREKLGDSATTPRYVETLPGRGYRFIGKVESEEAELSPIGPEPPQPRWKWKLVVGIAACAAIAGAAVVAYSWIQAPAVPRVSNYVQLTHEGKDKYLIGTEGSRLYFYSWSSDYQGMLEMSTSGDERKRIPVLPSPAFNPLSLSPDGSRLLAVEVQAGYGYGTGPLWSLPLLGGSSRRLGELVGRDAASSPDGKSLAYCNGNNVFVARADGTESRMLVTLKDPAVVSDPVWSPDGKSLRFDVADRLGGRLWEVSLDGTGLHRLLPGWTDSPDSECCGRWTTDGKYFLFRARGQVWALSQKAGPFRNRRKPIQLTFSPLEMANPTASTDGKKLFVVGRRYGAELMRYDMKSSQFLPFMGGSPRNSLRSPRMASG